MRCFFNHKNERRSLKQHKQSLTNFIGTHTHAEEQGLNLSMDRSGAEMDTMTILSADLMRAVLKQYPDIKKIDLARNGWIYCD